MSRRPLAHPVERLAKAQSRMAPGGLLWSESPIPRRYSPRVREAGEEEAPPTDPYLRPVSISGGTLVGGGGSNTLRDQSDTTYARLDRTPHAGGFTATFETRALGYEPTQARLYVRARSLVPVPNFYYVSWSMPGCCGFGPAPWTHPEYGGGVPLESQTGDTFHDMAAYWSTAMFGGGTYWAPTAAATAAGLQVVFDAAPSVADPGLVGTTFQIDIADVWLDLRSD